MALLNIGNVNNWPPERLSEFYRLEIGPPADNIDPEDAYAFGGPYALDSPLFMSRS